MATGCGAALVILACGLSALEVVARHLVGAFTVVDAAVFDGRVLAFAHILAFGDHTKRLNGVALALHGISGETCDGGGGVTCVRAASFDASRHATVVFAGDILAGRRGAIR